MTSGILLLDKPKGLSSNQALCKVKKYYRLQKIGHTGTLDPMASGMLPLCLGEATKFARFFLEAEKSYQVTAQFGATSSTGDIEGQITPVSDTKLDLFRLQAAIPVFLGEQTQIPPMFSAVKINGKPLYKLARKGIEVARPPRTITISKLELLNFNENLRQATFEVICSKGTYIRTLVQDLGNHLGIGAFVQDLRRLWVAPFQKMHAIGLDSLKEHPLDRALIAIESTLSHLPKVQVEDKQAFQLARGQVLEIAKMALSKVVTLHSPQHGFFGVGECKQEGKLSPMRLMQIL